MCAADLAAGDVELCQLAFEADIGGLQDLLDVTRWENTAGNELADRVMYE